PPAPTAAANPRADPPAIRGAALRERRRASRPRTRRVRREDHDADRHQESREELAGRLAEDVARKAARLALLSDGFEHLRRQQPAKVTGAAWRDCGHIDATDG